MENVKSLPSWHEWLLGHAWIVEAILVLSVLLFLKTVLKKALVRSKQRAHLIENDWRIHLDYPTVAPARALLWILLVSFSIELIVRELELNSASFNFISPLRNAGVISCLSWFLLRLKKVFHNAVAARRVKGKPSFDTVSLELIAKIFSIAVVFVSLLILLQIFGLDILPLVTFGGIGAAALGFASRDVIANFFGGLMLYITRPFTINDLIELPEKKVIGYIEEIGWYYTRVRDEQKKPIYIPNSVFSTEMLINQSRITHRLVEETVRIRYADIVKAGPIVEEIRTLLERHPEIDAHQPIYVYLHNFGPYSLELEIKAYTLATRYEEFMEIKQRILVQIHNIVIKAGAEIPYPTSTVEMSDRTVLG